MRYLIVNKKDFTAIEEDAASYTTFAEAHAEMLSCLNFNDLTIVRSFDCGENFTEYYDRDAQIWHQIKQKPNIAPNKTKTKYGGAYCL